MYSLSALVTYRLLAIYCYPNLTAAFLPSFKLKTLAIDWKKGIYNIPVFDKCIGIPYWTLWISQYNDIPVISPTSTDTITTCPAHQLFCVKFKWAKILCSIVCCHGNGDCDINVWLEGEGRVGAGGVGRSVSMTINLHRDPSQDPGGVVMTTTYITCTT